MKRLGNEGNGFLQKLDFQYLDNGFLSQINGPDLGGGSIPLSGCDAPNPTTGNSLDNNDLFYLNLKYYDPANSYYYRDGNIAQITWRVRGRERQSAKFTYDYQDRLKTSTTGEIDQSDTYNWNNTFSTTYSYDARGNISNLTRNGLYWNGNCWASGAIDNLSYSYYQSGGKATNRLMQVNETLSTAGKDEGFKPRSGSTQYSYDANGNIIYDPNKKMRVLYNHLNLPQRITIDGCKFIEFLYDAAGNKLQKTIKEGAMTLRTHDYLAGIEYQNGYLDAIYHAEGRVYYQDSTSRYEFCLKDHLGNTRLTFTDKNQDGVITLSATPDSNEVLSEQHYYPFGLAYNGPWIDNKAKQTRYLYNGKELESDFGLNWYAYGARYYDPVVGRFTGVDPISDEFPHVSTYNYAENEPIANIDLHGLQKLSFKEIFNRALGALGLAPNSTGTSIRAPESQEEADQISANRAAVKKLGEDLENVVEVQEFFVPGVGALREGKEGNAGGAVLLFGIDLATGGKGKSLKKAAGEVVEHYGELKVIVKIPRKLLDKPKKKGNAPTFKKDGTRVELHHKDQKNEGPFMEMHWKDHRGKGNMKKNHPKKMSEIDRKQFNKNRTAYWIKVFENWPNH